MINILEGRRGRDRMVVGLITTYAIRAYNCESDIKDK
jgi:hypothetical protein